MGFSTPVPDFTDCDFATREPDSDWIGIAYEGGPSEFMPAFGGALTVEQVELAVNHIRTFSTDSRWPRGELILPTGDDEFGFGNDNDADASLFEPHYETIDDPGKVQICEAIMGEPDGSVTTVLLSAITYLEDNRVLPEGFDKATAEEDIAVHGEAGADETFVGGRDRVGYVVAVSDAEGPFIIEAELWYQPVAYR